MRINLTFAQLKDGKEECPDNQSQFKGAAEPTAGRINPQLSCTIAPEDKELLNELSLYACNRERKMLNTSIIVRALIRLGNKYKDRLVFE